MEVLITGISNGIRRGVARVLAVMDIGLILVARRGGRPRESKRELAVFVDIVILDVSVKGNYLALCQHFRSDSADILTNNAGLGDFSEFIPTDLDKELNMISTNIQAVHILSKLFLWDFVKEDRGYILNVASSVAFPSGPLMATYYATKAHAERLALIMHKEPQKRGSRASVSVLCPGSVQTEFDRVADVRSMTKRGTSMDVASYAVRGMFREKAVMIPGILMKGSYLLCKCLSLPVRMKTSYYIQHRKNRQTNACISK